MAFIAQIRGKWREGEREGGMEGAREGAGGCVGPRRWRWSGPEGRGRFFIKEELNELNWGNAWI